MKNPYGYRKLISELNDLVAAGDLHPEDEIQVLRDTASYGGGYRPIIEWYYHAEDMANVADELLELMEGMDGRATFRHVDAEEIADLLQYVIDAPSLVTMKVSEVLRELWEHGTGARLR